MCLTRVAWHLQVMAALGLEKVVSLDSGKQPQQQQHARQKQGSAAAAATTPPTLHVPHHMRYLDYLDNAFAPPPETRAAE